MSLSGDEIKKANSLFAQFVDVDFPSGPLYAWSGLTPRTEAGKLYQPVGILGAVGPVRISPLIEVEPFQIGLLIRRDQAGSFYETFVEKAKLDRKQNVRGSRVRVYRASFDKDSGDIIEGQKFRVGGKVAKITLNIEPQQTSLVLECEPLIGGALTHTAVHLTGADQRTLAPIDAGLDGVSIQSSNLTVKWDPVA